MDNNLHKGHRDRVKKRFVNEGLDAFDDHQVLELLLFYAVPQKDTNLLAHKLLKEFGSLSGLFEAAPEDVVRRCSVSPNTAILLSLIPSLSRRYTKDRWKDRPRLDNPDKASEYIFDYIKSQFIGRPQEVFLLVCLDAQNKVLHCAVVHEGTVGEVPVLPRSIVELTLRHNSHSVILAHNHPGGSLQPSPDDIAVTKTIIAALQSIDIAVRDHIIVAGENYTSMKQQGYF